MTTLLHSIQPTCRGIKSVVSEATPAYIKLTEFYIIQNLIVAASENTDSNVLHHLHEAATEITRAIAVQEGLAR